MGMKGSARGLLGIAVLVAATPMLAAQDVKERIALAVDDTGHHVLSVAWSPDGKLLAAGTYPGTVILWEMPRGRERASLHGHGPAVYSVAFSPDGTTLASGGADGTVRLWDPATGKERRVLARRGDAVRTLA